MRRIAVACSLAALIFTVAGQAAAKPCRDAAGKFTACPAAATAQRCRSASGQFVKCGAPGAKPADMTPMSAKSSKPSKTAAKPKP